MALEFWLWSLALRNLHRNRKRNFFIACTMASSFAGLLLFTGYIVRAEKNLRTVTVYLNQVGHIAISRRGAALRQLTSPREVLMSIEEQKAAERLVAQDPRINAVGRTLQSFMILSIGCATH